MRSGVSRVEIPQKWCGQLQQRASSAGCASLDGAARQNLGPDQAGISCQTAPTPESRLLGGAQQDAEMVQNLCTPVGGVENTDTLRRALHRRLFGLRPSFRLAIDSRGTSPRAPKLEIWEGDRPFFIHKDSRGFPLAIRVVYKVSCIAIRVEDTNVIQKKPPEAGE